MGRAAQITVKRSQGHAAANGQEYFSDALKLASEEIDAAYGMTRAILLRLEIWKDHYSGDIAFYRESSAKLELVNREEIHEYPPTHFSFRSS